MACLTIQSLRLGLQVRVWIMQPSLENFLYIVNLSCAIK